MAQTAGINLSHDGHQKQLDSLLNEVNHNNDMNQLGLLVLYEQAANSKHPDSVNIFKKLALLNADLEQPKDAYKYTLKYIYNTFDFSILKDNSFKPIKETDEYKKLNDLFSFKIDGLCFFYFYAALIGFFFTIVINFSKKAKPYSRVLIATFVGIQSLFILEFVLYATNLRYQYPHTYRLSSACVLLLGPVIYFYFKSVSPNFKFKPKDALHLLPSLCLLFFLLPVYLASANEKYSMMLGLKASTYSYNVVVFLAKVVSLIIYSFFIWRLFKANRYSEIYKNAAFKRKWEAGIFNVYIAYIISYVLYGLSILTELGNISIIIYNAMVGLMCFMLIYIVYLGYVQSDVFNNTFVPLNKRLFSKKYQKSGLTSTLSTELKENLEKLLVQDKVFKENNINLELLAFKLNTTRHNASQIINEHFKMNFFELINSFRIKEAIKILEEDSHGNLNIIDIAYEVGYNNKVTFNKAFKKVTKTTPSHYINTLLTNSTSK
ncbi:MAG: helix-turn-helix domain-containing protein [Algibacter sp.]|uniref:helix-turn-helix domain-containing protein n=1 Tax=Algibacter sp. TaxID=1872428 RepID=UPI003298DCE8